MLRVPRGRSTVATALAIVSLLVPVAGARADAAGVRCSGEHASPSTDLQMVLDRSPEGAVICLAPGLYRPGAPLRPRQSQTIRGGPRAVISGAKVVEGFAREGADFVASAYLPSTQSASGECITPGCSITQDVYVDNMPLVRVLSRPELAPGRYFQDFGQNKLYLRDDPSGHLVEQAFLPVVFEASSPRVTLSDFVVEKAATEAQRGAVTGGESWRIEHLEVRYSHGVGINCGALNCSVRGNYIHHNGQLGFGGSDGSDVLVEANEVAFNNTAGYKAPWEAGGGKWTRLRALTLRNNYVHDNHGAGLWTDINTEDVAFTGNYVSRNSHVGIEHEISYAATITGNTVVANGLDPSMDLDGWGGAGILVSASPGVKVAENIVADNRNGIIAMQQDRSRDAPDSRGAHRIQELDIRDNSVSMDRGVTGLIQDIGDRAPFSASYRNVFAANHYHLDSLASARFAWNDRAYSAKDWVSEGNDRDGTFDTTQASVSAPPKLVVGPRAD